MGSFFVQRLDWKNHIHKNSLRIMGEGNRKIGTKERRKRGGSAKTLKKRRRLLSISPGSGKQVTSKKSNNEKRHAKNETPKIYNSFAALKKWGRDC